MCINKKLKYLTPLLLGSVLFTGCGSKGTLDKNIVSEIVSGEYSDRFSPLAKSNLEQCREYFNQSNINDFNYEVLTNDEYYTVLVTNNSNSEFECVLNVWYDSRKDIVTNACIEYSTSREVIETLSYDDGIEYEPGFVPGSCNLIFEDQLNDLPIEDNNENENVTSINIDELIPDFNESETTQRNRLEGKEIVTREPEITDPSITFVYE